jgi:hypothetical protein
VDSPSMTVHDVALCLKVDEKIVYRLAQRGIWWASGLPGPGASNARTSTPGSSSRRSAPRRRGMTTRTNGAASLAVGRGKDATF